MPKNGKGKPKNKESTLEEKNKHGIEIMKSDPKGAEIIFFSIYEKVEKGTVLASEILVNIGQCRIIRSGWANCPLKQFVYFKEAEGYFLRAINEYPGNKKRIWGKNSANSS